MQVHYGDTDGHGTHCGGTATGLNFGWASNARVYSVKVGGLEGPGDTGGISISSVRKKKTKHGIPK